MSLKEWAKRRFIIDDRSYGYLKKSIFACLFKNIILMLQFVVLFLFAADIFGDPDFDPNLEPWVYIVMAAVSVILLFISYRYEYARCFVDTYNLGEEVRVNMAEKIRRLPLSFFSKKDPADLSLSMLKDVNVHEVAMTHFFPEIIAAMIYTVAMAVIIIAVSPLLGLAAVWPIPFAIAIVLLSKNVKKRWNTWVFEKSTAVVEAIQEGLEAGRDIKVNDAEEKFLAEYAKKTKGVERYERDASLVTLLFVTSAQFLIHFGIVTTALVGSYLLCNGDVSAILFFGYLILISRVYRPLDSELNNLESLIRSEDSINRMREMDDYPKQAGATEFEPSGYDICFENVKFAYNAETEVLNDISFTAKQGEITAIVGPSGGGKSTVARLASRFWDVDSGKITVGGVDISTVDPETLLSKYSIVFQDVILFNNTVMENIRVGRKNATDEEVIAAAQAAMCKEFVDNLPKGYDTMIGENGMKLSGGERQRISIARAILKDAPIILLDEATASLDAECETKVQAALSTLIVGKTVLVVAHRMRTIEGADKILVLQDGTVKEQGMPDELIASEGAFARMCHLQHSSGDWMIHN